MIIEYAVENKKPVIYVFSRDKNGNRISEKITDFLPYFYVLDSDKIPNDKRITIEPGNFVSIFGEKLKKIIVDIPSTVKEIRGNFTNNGYESDIPFVNRFLIDRVEKLEKIPWHVVFFDIEISSRGRMPSIDYPENEIIVICVYSSFLDKYVSFVWHYSFRERRTYMKSENWEIREFTSEKEMLSDFINFLRDIDFDILSGWYIQDFDLPYLKARCDYHGIDFKILSPLHSIDDEEIREIKIRGRVIFDLQKGYKAVSDRRRSYTLAYIAKKENLLVQKTEIDRDDIGNIFDNNINEILQYNKSDVEILVVLNKKLNILDYFDNRCIVSHSLWNDVLLNSRVIDNLFLKKFFGKIVFPSKPVNKEKPKSYEGAVIITPKPGLHENVANLDVTSMYPSIIISANISPETFDLNGKIVIDENHKFKDSPPGIFTQVFADLFALRKNYQNEMSKYPVGSDEYNIYDKLQFAVKGLINTIYGVMGFSASRFYRKECAESVTFLGRKITLFCKEIAEKNGFEVIYGDTDSIFVKKDNASIDDYRKLMEILNNSFSVFFEQFNIKSPGLSIKFEKLFKRIFFYEAKKRFAGIISYEKGKECNEIEITGLEAKRSDNSDFGEYFQQKLLSMVLSNQPKKEIINFVRDCVKKIKNREIPVKEIAIPKMITKPFEKYKANTPHVRGSIYANTYLGTNYNFGDKVKILWLKSTGKYPPANVVCFTDDITLPADFVYDENKMVELNIIQKLQRIFKGLGWSVDDIFVSSKLTDFTN